MNLIKVAAVVACMGLILSGCAEGPPPPRVLGHQENAVSQSGYALGAGDKLRLIVFGEDNLSGEFTVSSSGVLAFPLVGEVPAKGRSIDAVREDVEHRLDGHFVKNPRVSLEVITYRPFYILGEVNKPGEFPFEPNLTVLGAVASAQGFTYRANVRKVFIKHAGHDAEAIYNLSGDLEVQPGDVIRVGERFF